MTKMKVLHPRSLLGAGLLAGCLALVGLVGTSTGDGKAHASPVPDRISKDSSVADILRFAESAPDRWRTLSADGHMSTGGGGKPFKVWVSRDGRSRVEHGDDVRVRNGKDRVRRESGNGSVRRYSVPGASAQAEQGLRERMAAHRANDPSLAREGETMVDTPVNDLVSPARIVRKELGLTARSVRNVGSATVAGRDAVVLQATFPAELAKEDHWDVYVDIETGVLLGLVIEPLPGGDRYESFIDSLTVDPVVPDELFDCSADPKPTR